MARNPRTIRHGEGVFRRFAAEAAGGARPRGGQPAGAGPAVWGECCLGVEDFSAAEADGPDGTDRAASRAVQPHHGGGAGEDTPAGKATTRGHAGGAATT